MDNIIRRVIELGARKEILQQYVKDIESEYLGKPIEELLNSVLGDDIKNKIKVTTFIIKNWLKEIENEIVLLEKNISDETLYDQIVLLMKTNIKLREKVFEKLNEVSIN